MIYVCLISFSTHPEEGSDTEGRFAVLCEAPNVESVLKDQLPKKLEEVMGPLDRGYDFSEFYLSGLVEVPTLTAPVVLGYVEQPIRAPEAVAAEIWSEVLPADESKVRVSKYAGISDSVPFMSFGKPPSKLKE